MGYLGPIFPRMFPRTPDPPPPPPLAPSPFHGCTDVEYLLTPLNVMVYEQKRIVWVFKFPKLMFGNSKLSFKFKLSEFFTGNEDSYFMQVWERLKPPTLMEGRLVCLFSAWVSE